MAFLSALELLSCHGEGLVCGLLMTQHQRGRTGGRYDASFVYDHI